MKKSTFNWTRVESIFVMAIMIFLAYFLTKNEHQVLRIIGVLSYILAIPTGNQYYKSIKKYNRKY